MSSTTTPSPRQSTAGHETIRGHATGPRSDLSVLRAYWRAKRDPAAIRRSLGSRVGRTRKRKQQPLTPAQARLIEVAESFGLNECALMDRLQKAKLVAITAIWVHDLADVECLSVVSLGPWIE